MPAQKEHLSQSLKNKKNIFSHENVLVLSLPKILNRRNYTVNLGDAERNHCGQVDFTEVRIAYKIEAHLITERYTGH
jgi:hypothetical protein